MSAPGTEPTCPHDQMDHRLRVRRLEQQVSIVADALRVLADAVDANSERAIAKQIEEMLHDACL